MARMPASHAEVVSEGATTTLIVRATDPANLDELRRHMHHHAEMMQEGQCPMMATGHGEAEKSPEEAKKEFWEPLTDLWPSIPMGF